ncbi:MAG: hypothetical protein U0R50_03880 [Gaiellales bacterium]
MGKIPKRTPEEREADEHLTTTMKEYQRQRLARILRAEAREAAHRARLRRWTFGLLGREPDDASGSQTTA